MVWQKWVGGYLLWGLTSMNPTYKHVTSSVVNKQQHALAIVSAFFPILCYLLGFHQGVASQVLKPIC